MFIIFFATKKAVIKLKTKILLQLLFYFISLSNSSNKASTNLSSGTLFITSPLRKTNPSPFPPAIPISASRASPGPFTTQPITATLIGFVIPDNLCSTFSAILGKSILQRPQVGHEISVGPYSLRPNAFKISFATFTSFTGSPVKEMRNVSPMPSASSSWAAFPTVPTHANSLS